MSIFESKLNLKQNESAPSYRYILMPGQVPMNFPHVHLHNKAFKYWRSFWTDVFNEISPGEKVRDSDFYRQKWIAVLMDEQQIVALHLYSFFNLDSDAALATEYLASNYTIEDQNVLEAKGIRSVMSMEYLTIDPQYQRGKKTSLPISILMIGLGYRVLQDSGYDSMIAPCRCDVKVDKKAELFGAIELRSPFMLHGVPVRNMVTPASRIKSHPDRGIQLLINQHWQRREYLLDSESKQRLSQIAS